MTGSLCIPLVLQNIPLAPKPLSVCQDFSGCGKSLGSVSTTLLIGALGEKKGERHQIYHALVSSSLGNSWHSSCFASPKKSLCHRNTWLLGCLAAWQFHVLLLSAASGTSEHRKRLSQPSIRSPTAACKYF